MSGSLPPEPPTYFANIATVHVNVDEVSIEFRRVMLPHAQLWTMQKDSQIPPLTEDDLYQFPPQAKVVLTFVGAKTLHDNLAKLLPTMEQQRKQG
jgi:hypothetical protein